MVASHQSWPGWIDGRMRSSQQKGLTNSFSVFQLSAASASISFTNRFCLHSQLFFFSLAPLATSHISTFQSAEAEVTSGRWCLALMRRHPLDFSLNLKGWVMSQHEHCEMLKWGVWLIGVSASSWGYMLRNSLWQQGKGLASLKHPSIGDIRGSADKPAAGKCEDATNALSYEGQCRSTCFTLNSGHFVFHQEKHLKWQVGVLNIQEVNLIQIKINVKS